MFSIKAVFNRTKRKNDSGKYTVNIRVVHNQKTTFFSIKNFPKIEPEYWDTKNNQVKSSHPYAWKLNEILYRNKDKINNYCLDMLMKDQNITFTGIREYFNSNNADFLTWAESYARTKTYTNYLKYKVLINKINDFDKNIRFEKDYLHNFKDYLASTGIIENSQAKQFSMLKTLYNEACRQRVIAQPDPYLFDFIKFNKTKPNRISISLDQVQHIYGLKFKTNKELETVKDQFVFLCLTGMYYSDLKSLDTKKDIQIMEKGFCIVRNRVKNENEFIVPLWLWPEQMQIIEKYKNKGESIFPEYFSDQHFNRCLKAVCEMAGIKKKLTNKVGRHTFADLCISRGIPRQFVSRMLGHTNENTTQVYYKMNVQHFANSI